MPEPLPVAMGIPVADSVPLAEDASVRTGAHVESVIHGLNGKGFPLGLCNALRSSLELFPLRIWIVDNSGSMASSDGFRFAMSQSGGGKKIRCTRWQELADTVGEIGELSTMLGARTDFHFLNSPPGGSQYVSLAGASAATAWIPPAGPAVPLSDLTEAMRKPPGGGTPLAESVCTICRMLELPGVADKLRAHGQKVVVVIATDGHPNDRASFLRAMQRLQKLPVWIVCRLCTSDDSVTNYYSSLDKNLEAPLEVLDDICGEAAEVRKANPCVTYGAPLHLLREWGLHEKLFDLLDEQPMIPSQLKQLLEFVLGCKPLPEPELDQPAFLKAAEAALTAAPTTFDALKLRRMPWFDLAALKRQLQGGDSCTIA